MSRHLCLISSLLILSPWVAYSQAEPPKDKYVSREEYDKLKGEMEALKAQMAELMKKQEAPPPAEAPAPNKEPSEGKQVVSTTTSQNEIDELRDELAKIM